MMSAMGKKMYLSDSFESQKKIAHEVVNGLLAREIMADCKSDVSQSELRKAKIRGGIFAKKYGF